MSRIFYFRPHYYYYYRVPCASDLQMKSGFRVTGSRALEILDNVPKQTKEEEKGRGGNGHLFERTSESLLPILSNWFLGIVLTSMKHISYTSELLAPFWSTAGLLLTIKTEIQTVKTLTTVYLSFYTGV